MSIHLLPDSLINKIAAGEVVERPASVVKELVENSLDAGADFITVELKNGGMDLIEIIDNGKGMGRDDAKMCVLRHATSKIDSLDDLYNISTFGFRGEALAAISSVSKFTLQTKEKGESVGTVMSNFQKLNEENESITPSNTSPSPFPHQVRDRLSERRGKAILPLSEGEAEGGGSAWDKGCFMDSDSNRFKSAGGAGTWEIKDAGCPEGTKIRVADLFYNVPARRKFLKSIPTEFGHVLNILSNMALVNSEVRFKFIHNGKVVFDYHANIHEKREDTNLHEKQNNTKESEKECRAKIPGMLDRGTEIERKSSEENEKSYAQWKERVRMILGAENFSHMRHFYRESGEMIIQGFVSEPVFTKMNKSQQYIFVNSRPVNNNIIQKAVYEAYRNSIPRDSYPMFVLKIDIEPELVDVNVHPRKLEVKFLHQSEVFKIIASIIKEVIAEGGLLPKRETDFYAVPQPNANFILADGERRQSEFPKSGGYKYDQAKNYFSQRGEHISRASMDFTQEMFFPSDHASMPELAEPQTEKWNLLGQVKAIYLIVSTEEQILIIDQHAAHERMLYDKLDEEMKNGNFKSQPLISPLKIEVTLSEMELFKKNLELLKNIGFDIEEFGTNTIIVQAVPQDMVHADIRELVKGLIGDLGENEELDNTKDALEKMRTRAIKYLACHSAVRGGDFMDEREQKALVNKIMDGTIKPTCPHGRPIMVNISFEEIEKKLKRKT